MKINYKFLDYAYQEFVKTQEKKKLIQYIYLFFPKILKRNYHDEETIYNFVLYFIENQLDKCLMNFSHCSFSIEFHKYLTSAMKKSFVSYINQSKDLYSRTYLFSDYHLIYFVKDNHSNYYQLANIYENFWHLVEKTLEFIPMHKKIVFKLYYGFLLNSQDLKYLIEKYGFRRTKNFLKKHERKILLHREKSKGQEERSHYFFWKSISHSHYFSSDYKELRYALYRRRIAKKVIPTSREIIEFLNISRSQFYGYLFQSRKIIRNILQKTKIQQEIKELCA